MPSGVLWMTGGTLYEGPGFIWRVERSGAVRQWCELPDALFMNGCTMHPNGRTLLACESASGHILAIDLGQPGRWDVWLAGGSAQADRARISGVERDQDPRGLGVDQRLRTQVDGPRADPTGWLRRRYRNCGNASLVPTTSRSECPVRSIITTHPEHTLVRLDPSGARTTLAGPEQGMVGSTACAFGRARGDEKALYVTTDGGFLIPHESGIQDAKLVRMEVGESGWPLLQGV